MTGIHMLSEGALYREQFLIIVPVPSLVDIVGSRYLLRRFQVTQFDLDNGISSIVCTMYARACVTFPHSAIGLPGSTQWHSMRAAE
jgi:hypothetical protein